MNSSLGLILKGGEGVGYKVKRGPTPTNGTMKEMLTGFMKRLIVVFILIVAMGWIGYFLFEIWFKEVPVFADAADDVIVV